MHLNPHPARAGEPDSVEKFVAFFGTKKFLGYMTIFIVSWVTLNVIGIFGLHWDPYPFILLNLVFSTQASYAAPMILLSQNRKAELDEAQAAHDHDIAQDTNSGVNAIISHFGVAKPS